MKATVETKDLIKALAQVNQIPKNRQLAALHYMKMNFHDGKLTIQSTDLQRAVTAEIKAESDSPFAIVLPRYTAGKFVTDNKGVTKFCKGSERDNAPATIEQEGIGKVTLETIKPTDFPPIPIPSNPLTYHPVDAKWLCRMLTVLLTACAKEDSRPVLTGICLKEGAMASADGFRLVSVKSEKLELGLADKQLIIPKETALLVIKLFAGMKTVLIATEGTKVYFTSEDSALSILSELVQGAYPQYEQLIPVTFNSHITVSAPLMVQRLNMMDTLETSGIVRFYTNEDNILYLAAKAEEMYEYLLTIPIKYSGETKIAVAHRYLIEAVKPFSLCHIETTTPSSPIKITGDIKELTITIMPMFVAW